VTQTSVQIKLWFLWNVNITWQERAREVCVM